jgi:histidinol dehydrogenase
MNRYLQPKKEDWDVLLKRPTATYAAIEPLVFEVFDRVQKEGDVAVNAYTQKFDMISTKVKAIAPTDILAAEANISEALKTAIKLAKENIVCFHKAQKTAPVKVETQPGVHCWQEKRPIEKVGLYIPGGSAPLFSTLLMLAIPAKLAGCREIVLCTPPDAAGKIPDVILYTASLCGVDQIFAVGGIQAIAAMTFGTETIPGVYKIFGPGNQFVTVAKQVATRYQVAIDMPAGPSELLIVADDSANPEFIASDLLSQAEHGPDSQVLLVSLSEGLMEKVQLAIDVQLQALPRKDIAAQALANSKMIYFSSDAEAITFINAYGPEHYIVCVKNEDKYLTQLVNAGSVFIGNYTPESAGDYASGTNHTLPTNGYAKQYSGVNLDSFLKAITFQKIDEKGIQKIGPAIELMAAAEGLEAHKNAVSLRLNSLKK